jgi:CRP-like cAMP-binding protein
MIERPPDGPRTGRARAALRQISFFRDLPDAALDLLATGAGLRRVDRGTIITIEGEPADAMYLVLVGRVKVTRISKEGREQIIHLIRPGDHFNLVPMFDGGPCPATAEALDDSELLMILRTTISRVLDTYPDLARTLLRELAGRLRHMVAMVEDLGLHSVQTRLARLLLREAVAAEQGDPARPLTQADMAAQLGTVREMISRALKTLENEGLIVIERGNIRIVDRTGLEHRAAT